MMKAGRTGRAHKAPNQAAVASTPRVKRSANTRLPVDRILPASLTEQIHATVRAVPVVTTKLAEEVDGRFEIEARFGVSKRRLRNYLKHLHDNGNDAAHDQGSPAESAKLRAHRLRQASVASILDATFGPLADCNPELWDRRAYLMLVGLVYDRLAGDEDALPAKELIGLAKVLAEARRADARAREQDRNKEPDESPPPPTGPLPENFADIVRQVYGTNFHAPSETRTDHVYSSPTGVHDQDRRPAC